MAAALAALNTFPGDFLNSAKLRKVTALAGLNTFRGFFNSAKLRKVAELTGLNTFRGLFNTEKIRMVAALAGLNTFRGAFLILQHSARWQTLQA
jgi:hypothetical protein